MNRKNIIEAYFSSWLTKNRLQFEAVFSEDIIYSECYGPEYHGLEQVTRWFDDWNTHGTVLVWEIRNLWEDNGTFIAEWYFQCEYNGNVDGFDGISLIRFNGEGKITSVKEFQSKAEHCLPYEQPKTG